MEVLAKLFGGAHKVRLMRLFLLNPEVIWDAKEVAKRAKIVNRASVNKELNDLQEISFLQKKSKDKEIVWQLDPLFPFLHQLKTILKNDLISRKKDLTRQFSRCGKISLLVISGVLMDSEDGRADLLVVGDHLKKQPIDKVVKNLEAETGKELNYAILDTQDFLYRLNASDKFIRELLDSAHSVIIDRLGLSL